MTEVDAILNFIDASNEPTKQAQSEPQSAQPPAPTPAPSPAPTPAPTQTNPVIFGTSDFTLSDDITDKDYKKHLSQLSRLKKKNQFPCIFGPQIIHNEQELADCRKKMMTQMRTIRGNRKSESVKNTRLNLDTLPEVEDESELAQDGDVMYSTKHVAAVRDSNGKLRKVPSTSANDRKKLYDAVKNDKELLKQLIQEADPDMFRQKTSEKLPEELKPVYESHADNNINKDETWTRESLISFIKTQMKKQQSQRNHQPKMSQPQQQQPQQTMPYGLNPALFGR